MADWLRQSGDDVVVMLHVQPGAKRSEVAGRHGDSLKIRLAAPPVDGKANDCLVAFVAERLGIPRARVSLIAGKTSREKRLCLHDVDVARAESLLRDG